MNKQIRVFEITQPIGTFYIGKIAANELIKISKVIRRSTQPIGVQRDLIETRVKSISQYCDDPDATFPTPIILSVQSTDTEKLLVGSCESNSGLTNADLVFQYDDSHCFAEILDGQHRIEGISKNGNFTYDLIIVLMFDLTKEEQAYVFSTINSNQVKVDKSTIYDLFELSERRSPYKTCHEIARIMNSDTESPFYRKLKMLGKKTEPSQTLAQGAFVTYLVELISKDPKGDAIDIKNNKLLNDDDKYPFRKYFIADNDAVILKILYNYFNAVTRVFSDEWINSDRFILSKTTGFAGLMQALKEYYKVGLRKKTLDLDFFESQLINSRLYLQMNDLLLTSEFFSSNSAGVNKLAQALTHHFNF